MVVTLKVSKIIKNTPAQKFLIEKVISVTRSPFIEQRLFDHRFIGFAIE